MKLRDRKDLFNKSTQELEKLLADARKALFDLHMNAKLGKVKDTRSLFWKRKETAYILTQLQLRKEQSHG